MGSGGGAPKGFWARAPGHDQGKRPLKLKARVFSPFASKGTAKFVFSVFLARRDSIARTKDCQVPSSFQVIIVTLALTLTLKVTITITLTLTLNPNP